jgi:5'-nucleotidase
MHILVTNDEGLAAPGLWALACGLAHLGRISVAAPVDSHAGQVGLLGWSHSAGVESIEVDPAARHLAQVFLVHGTPATCALLSARPLLASPPDAVVAGIKPGLTAGVDVWLSGAVSATRTACLLGRPALAVSLDYHARADDAEPAWETAAELAAGILQTLAHERWPAVLLNLNVPDRPHPKLAGLVATVPTAVSGLKVSVQEATPGTYSVGLGAPARPSPRLAQTCGPCPSAWPA